MATAASKDPFFMIPVRAELLRLRSHIQLALNQGARRQNWHFIVAHDMTYQIETYISSFSPISGKENTYSPDRQ